MSIIDDGDIREIRSTIRLLRSKVELIECALVTAPGDGHPRSDWLQDRCSTRLVVRYKPDYPKFTPLAANRYFYEFFGLTAGSFLGGSAFVNIHPDDRDRVLDKLRDVARNRLVLVGIEKNITRDGKVVVVRWADRPIFDNRGEVVEMLGIGEPM